jgi:CRP/FNR family transcriptional regulator, cyclic AMP receptor protein
MSFTEALGYLASALVLATFCMRDMVALRCMAIASNLAFIAYGALADVGPVLLLHLLLLPVNVQRLMAWRSSTQAAAAPDRLCTFKERRHE